MTDASQPTPTLNALFRAAASRWPDKPLLFAEREGAWQSQTYGEVLDAVDRTARGLAALGVGKGDRVALISENRPEWAIADLAILSLGAVCVPVYITLTASQIQYIVEDSGAVAAVVSTADLAARAREVAANVEALRHVVLIDAAPAGDGELTFAELQSREHDIDVAATAAAVVPEDLASFIYTSGTTGPPKGVMLTHANFGSNAYDTLTVLPLGPDDRHMSFLPLCHAFERTAGHYLMLHAGAEIWYVSDVTQVIDKLPQVRPTLFVSVPRLYEKVRDAMTDRIATAPGLKGKLARWSLRVAHAAAERRLAQDRPPHWGHGGLSLMIADALVLSKLRDRFGGRIKMMCSGGAALPQSVWRFFFDIGLVILEGYGLSETSPVASINRGEWLKPGTVGPPIPNVEVKTAEDGELLVRGPNIMRGYHNLPEKTAEVLTADGWFHTGDIGEVDADGYIRITDRKKDIIVTSGGKNVAPQVLESHFKSDPFVAEFVVCGDGRNYLTALIVPDWAVVEPWAAERGLPADRAALLAHADLVAEFDRRIAERSGDLARYETIKKFALLGEDFTVESGLMTPTMKVKRRVVYDRFAEQIEALYAS